MPGAAGALAAPAQRLAPLLATSLKPRSGTPGTGKLQREKQTPLVFSSVCALCSRCWMGRSGKLLFLLDLLGAVRALLVLGFSGIARRMRLPGKVTFRMA